MASIHRNTLLLRLFSVLVVVFLWLPRIEAGNRRVHIPDDLSDVVDSEEDDDWKEWGKFKPKRPEFDPPPDFKEGMDLLEYQSEMIKRQFGPSMGFAKLRIDVPRELDEAPQLARKWSELLKTGSIDAKILAVDKYTIMFTIPNGQDAMEVKDFVLSQPEAYEFKLGQNTFRRPGDPDLDIVMERMRMERGKKQESNVKEEL